MVEFDLHLDTEGLKVEELFMCGDCLVEMKAADPKTMRCTQCGQSYTNS